MNSPWTKAKVSEKRRRNYVAKRLREDRQFLQKRKESKRAEDDDSWKDEVEEAYGNQDDCY